MFSFGGTQCCLYRIAQVRFCSKYSCVHFDLFAVFSELVFRLREADRYETENNGFIEVVVEVANQRDLASPISLVLTPSIAP